MPINKQALVRYIALDRCFSNFNRFYYIEDLIEVCNEALYSHTGNSAYSDPSKPGISRRQILNDIAFMESEEGYRAPIEHIKSGKRVYYRYDDKDFSIRHAPITDEELTQLQATLTMLNRFKGMPNFEWIDSMVSNMEDKFHLKGSSENVIGLDGNDYAKGNEFITPIFNAIVNRTALHIAYKTFHKGERDWIIHPYYLKQYNSRWFLIGQSDSNVKRLTNVALDRIASLEQVSVKFRPNISVDDFNEYFEDIIGVSIPEGREVEKVVLRFSCHRFPYVESKPMHGSQRVINRAEGLVSIEVIPNPELEALLLSFGEDVEVVEPKWLRNSISENVRKIYEKYFPMHKDCTDGL